MSMSLELEQSAMKAKKKKKKREIQFGRYGVSFKKKAIKLSLEN